ncbi:non-ribosomal peptide synthetase [Tumebacillus sp. BK434]|uniref:non-ribosomal peptide synthetase family protein n=1 Tax=Tumebacillus sp. BK434 TaxID=2512169 RepID=UPI001FB2C447|nr:non-ribosomal peptide synthetase [Tumebacillus sp. BK434]
MIHNQFQLATDFSRLKHQREVKIATALMMNRDMIKQPFDVHDVVLTVFAVFFHRYTGASLLQIGVDGTERVRAEFDLALSDTFETLLTNVTTFPADNLPVSVVLGRETVGIRNWMEADGEIELGLVVEVQEHSMQLSFLYDAGLFAEDTILRMSANLRTLLLAVGDSFHLQLRDLPVLSEGELHLLRSMQSAEPVAYPDELTVQELFAKHPGDRIALRFAESTLTYAQLDARSNQLAHLLRAKGYGKGKRVALLLDRSFEMVIGILGVLKAGAAYVPIDPDAPQVRIDYLLQDCQTELVVTRRHLQHRLNQFPGNVLTFEEQQKELEALPDTALPLQNTADDLAYVIYTSGSTGNPKGAMLTHRGVSNLAMAQADVFGIHEQSRILQTASFSFDASILEIFFALLRGGCLVLVESGVLRDPIALTELLAREKITFALLSPAMIAQLPLHAGPDLEALAAGGDVCPAAVARAWAQRVDFLNAYGPTEATVCATAWSSKRSDTIPDNLPIGRPLPNCSIYILDAAMCEVPVGVFGEIYIASPGLAQGYLNRAALTTERFLNNPFAAGMLYKTGDLGRFLPDGNIEFGGRIDKQVKIRGFRIELGEIENVLRKHPAVQECVVVAVNGANGLKRIVGYIVAKEKFSLAEIREFLSERLPDYMVPAFLLPIAKIPMTLNGKVDERALPAPEEAYATDPATFSPPVTDIQKKIAGVWEAMLGVKQVGIDDDFFALGGDSMTIFPILLQLKPDFPELKIQDFYTCRTVAALEAHLRRQEQAASLTFSVAEEDRFVQPTKPMQKGFQMPRAVLLTGATGFLGSHVLYDLIETTSARIYCLVRAKAQTDADVRLFDTLHFYFGEQFLERVKDRVAVLQGDLAADDLGLSADDRQLIEQEVDAILHCGADVRHYGDEAEFLRINVRGTEQLLHFAKRRHGVRFHLVSTLSTATWAPPGVAEYIIDEGSSRPSEQTADNVYVKSKCYAEELVRQAIAEGCDASIYRVGNLIGHSVSGKFQRNVETNAFYRSLKAVLLLEAAVADQHFIDLTPIDFCSRALVYLACRRESSGQTLHVCNPEGVRGEAFVKLLQACGYPIRVMESEVLQNWVYQLAPDSELQEGRALMLAHLLEAEGEGPVLRYDCSRTMRLLAEAGISCPQPDRQLVQNMIEYVRKIGYVPEPKQPV